jgi:SAM-dependent methyltransferase
MPAIDPTQRFSSRVDQYTKYRPGYPPEIVELLRAQCGLTPSSVIADVASGTGLFTKLLLENGNEVYGVEPNAEMRKAGEEYVGVYSRFHSVAGKAEATGLPDQSMDLVTAAQAAHWFDRDAARREFLRILKPAGWTVLVWNERCTDSTPFLRAYEELLLRYGTDYAEVRHERTTATLHTFFAPKPFESRVFDYRQAFDYEGLAGRLLSSSYTPAPGEPNHEPMLRELRKVFDTYQKSGKVEFDYKTRVYFGRLA